MLITSLENNKIKKYIKLKNKKYRDEERLFLIEGEHLVEEALKSNLLVDLLVLENTVCPIDFPYTYVTLPILKKLSDMESIPSIIGVARIQNNLKMCGNRVLLVDGIQDPGNLGTIIRSCVAFRVTDIILSPDTVDLYNDKVIRASQGMIFKINILKKDLVEVIKELKEINYLVFGTNVKNGVDASEIIASKFALVVGNEGSGVKQKIQEMCDKNIYIEMDPLCESLNVGVATSIILYELNR